MGRRLHHQIAFPLAVPRNLGFVQVLAGACSDKFNVQPRCDGAFNSMSSASGVALEIIYDFFLHMLELPEFCCKVSYRMVSQTCFFAPICSMRLTGRFTKRAHMQAGSA